MDIQYLLWLQNFRNSINDAWTPFMEWVSMFATTFLIMIPVFYYWNKSKKDGLFVLVSYYFAMLVTPITKLTACVYRPWIREAKIIPAGDAIKTATGYSFPSGHTTTCGPLAGGMGVVTWKNKKLRWLSVIFFAFVLLTAFSRNYLGVHTPQDVIVAILITVVGLIVGAKLVNYLAEHPEKENMVLLIVLIICVLGLVYITVKPYPMDYTAEGKLLVDPQKMMNDGYGDIGKVIGFCIARFIEKTWIRFRPTGTTVKGVIICLLALVPMWLLKDFFSPFLKSTLGGNWGKLSFSIIYTFYYIALIPLVLKLLDKWLHAGEKRGAKA